MTTTSQASLASQSRNSSIVGRLHENLSAAGSGGYDQVVRASIQTMTNRQNGTLALLASNLDKTAKYISLKVQTMGDIDYVEKNKLINKYWKEYFKSNQSLSKDSSWPDVMMADPTSSAVLRDQVLKYISNPDTKQFTKATMPLFLDRLFTAKPDIVKSMFGVDPIILNYLNTNKPEQNLDKDIPGFFDSDRYYEAGGPGMQFPVRNADGTLAQPPDPELLKPIGGIRIIPGGDGTDGIDSNLVPLPENPSVAPVPPHQNPNGVLPGNKTPPDPGTPITTLDADNPVNTITETEAKTLGIDIVPRQFNQDFQTGQGMESMTDPAYNLQTRYFTGIAGQAQAQQASDQSGRDIPGQYKLTDSIHAMTSFDTPTIRPNYIESTGTELVLTPEEQIRGDVEFDLFSLVKPGFGQGVANTLFVENENRDKNIRYAGNLFTPNTYDGPEMGAYPVRPSLRRVQTPHVQHLNTILQRDRDAQIESYMMTLVGSASNSVLPDDNLYLSNPTGRSRRGKSPMIPLFDTSHNWKPVKELAGYEMPTKRFRRDFDPLRLPENNVAFAPTAGVNNVLPYYVTQYDIPLL
jgi:hypothetical protein